ncbi:MAG: FCD domain-containing protein [Paracoccaceae bacterium]|nr:FCD domain-containing protein [Paracoccaceae bacterium]
MSHNTLIRLRNWLRAETLKDGARLPPERVLATDLGVSRSELRKALLVLEVEGRLKREVGRGTIVLRPAPQTGAILTEAITRALAERTGPHEAMIARLVLEPELARLAALHATPLQIAKARRLAGDMRGAPDWTTYERLDFDFHGLIAEAAGNPLLHEVHRVVNTVRQVVVWRKLSLPTDGPPADYHSFDEHDALVAALEQRNRNGARDAMRAHLESTLGTMTDGD